MPKLSRTLWLLLPPAVVAGAWSMTKNHGGADFAFIAAALVVATAASFAAFFFASRKGVTEPARAGLVTVLTSVHLSERHWVHAVDFRGKVLLIGATKNQMVVLDPGDTHTRSGDEGDFSNDGVDLRDTPRTFDGLQSKPRPAKPRTIAEAATKGRSAMSAASFAEFKAKLREARRDG